MATCPFCGGFRDDTYECECYSEWRTDCSTGHYPKGMIPGAFTYDVWRRVKASEQSLQLHPEVTDEQAQEMLAVIVRDANEVYNTSQILLQQALAREQKLKNSPRRKLY